MWASHPNAEKLMINTTYGGPMWTRHQEVENKLVLIFSVNGSDPLVDPRGQDIQRSKDEFVRMN